MSATVAIVGRPNVGKSTLFNRLVGRRVSIVHDQPGVTRDVVKGQGKAEQHTVEWVDTGGLEFSAAKRKTDALTQAVWDKAKQSMEEALILVLVMDGKQGLSPMDAEFAQEIRKFNKPILLAINKIDPGYKKSFSEEFYRLGFDEIMGVSAEHNLGINQLVEWVALQLDGMGIKPLLETELSSNAIRMAVVGRPNVGKSSLINAILGDDKMIVSDQAGTTRDMIDTIVKTPKGEECLLIDTAGIRKRSKFSDDLEFFSVVRSEQAIERAQVAVLLVDASTNITTQDQKIAAIIEQKRKGLMILANKMDLCRDSESFRKAFREEFYFRAPFLQFSEIRFVSAKMNFGLQGFFPQAKAIVQRMRTVLSEDQLKQAYQQILAATPPLGSKGYKLEFRRLSYRNRTTPTFFVRCNRPEWVPDELKRYWRNSLYDCFDFRGVPIRVIFHQDALDPIE